MVEMERIEDAAAAIKGLDKALLGDRYFLCLHFLSSMDAPAVDDIYFSVSSRFRS